MSRFCLLVAVVICALSTNAFPQPRFLDGRIVGGEDASIEDFPYQLSLQKYGSHVCGASIIGPNHALTAAHCIDGTSAQTVTLLSGSTNRNDGQRHSVVAIHQHEKYDSYNIDFDYAVLKVKEPFVFSSTTGSVKLATDEPSAGTNVFVTGWGTLESGGSSLPRTLQKVTVPIVKRSDCEKAYPDSITARMICAGVTQGGKDSCQGDSGGPMVVNGVQVGIVSWGAGCGDRGYPGVYSNVAAQRDWIQNKINQ